MKRWQQIGIIILGAIALMMLVIAVFMSRVNQLPKDREVIHLDAQPARASAVVVYHPGLSDNLTRAAARLGQLLNQQGFTVQIMVVGDTAAQAVADSDVVVIGSPVYFNQVTEPIAGLLKTIPSDKRLGIFTIGLNKDTQQDIEKMSQLASVRPKVARKWIGEIDDVSGTDFIQSLAD